MQNLQNFKKEYIKEELQISNKFGKIFVFIDFANVNNWFVEDNQTWDSKPLLEGERLEIDVGGVKEFSDVFAERTRIYYGKDPKNIGSAKFIDVLRAVFGKKDMVTKDLQKIKHYLADGEKIPQPSFLQTDDGKGDFIEVRKCNFDIEIAVDAIKMMQHYDTFCLFSGDADFVYLNNFLKRNKKSVIIVKGGYITSKLRKTADIIINAQQIKRHITKIKKDKNLH